MSLAWMKKTGIQALKRRHPTQPAKPGQVERVEFDYQRHGTQALIATTKWRRAK
jgi:putative transposase